MNELHALDAHASMQIPLHWTVARRLSSLSHALPSEGLRWPLRGAPLVLTTQLPFQTLADLDGLPVDVVLAETETVAELEALAAFGTRTGASVLAVVPANLPAPAWVALTTEHPSLAVLSKGAEPAAVRLLAARLTEQLVRERFILQALAHWRGQVAPYAGLALRETGGHFQLEPVKARPPVAPMATIEHVHVAGVLGLWFEGASKVPESLETSANTVHRKVERLPPGIQRALAPLPPLPGARLLLLEDDAHLATATARALETTANRLGRPLDITIVPSAEKARELVEAARNAPELVWADVRLSGTLTGVDFVRWLRQRKQATVVFGKAAPVDTAAIADLNHLGALHVSCEPRAQVLPALLTSGLTAAAEAQEIRRRVVEAALQDGRLSSLFERTLQGGAAGARANEVQARLSALEADRAPRPARTGDGAVLIQDLREDAARLAAPDRTNLKAASDMLGVDPKTLRKLLGLAPKDPEDDAATVAEPLPDD